MLSWKPRKGAPEIHSRAAYGKGVPKNDESKSLPVIEAAAQFFKE